MAMQQHAANKLEVETASQLFSRLCGKPCLSTVEKEIFREECHNKLVEISGPVSSGKTELLMHAVLNILLPKTFNNTSVNGLEGKVIFIDTSYKFSVLRLVTLMEQRLLKAVDTHTVESKLSAQFIQDSLTRFYKISCSSSKELLVSLLSLEPFLQANTNAYLLVIDDLYAYHWIDSLEAGHQKLYASNYLKSIVEILRQFTREYDINVIFTRSDIIPSVVLNNGAVSKYNIQCKDQKQNVYMISKKAGGRSSSCDYKFDTNGLKFL